jgi:hypothetical protein
MYHVNNKGYQYALPIMQIHPLSVCSIRHIIQVGILWQEEQLPKISNSKIKNHLLILIIIYPHIYYKSLEELM